MLGSNVSTVGGIQNAFIQAEEWECECIQIYTTPSRTWNVPKKSAQIIEAFKDAYAKSKVDEVVAHVPFLVNLASSNNDTRDRSITRLAIEIDSAAELNVKFIILHPGSCGEVSRLEGLDRTIEGLNKAIKLAEATKPIILLETMAGQGKALGGKFEDLRYIVDNTSKKERLGICFDTCHVYTSGYDIRGYEGYEATMKEFDAILGLELIRLFHLNGSKRKKGSFIDRHCNIDEGYLGLEFFQALLRDKRFKRIPKILEIPERDLKTNYNLQLLRRLGSMEETIVDPPLEAVLSEKLMP